MDAAPFRRGRGLLGFMNEQEAVDFLRGTCVFENEAELKSAQDKWASASRAVAELMRPLRAPERKPISQHFEKYLEQLAAQQAFKQTCGGNCTLHQIEIENLIAFQRNIDTEYASELASKMSSGGFCDIKRSLEKKPGLSAPVSTKSVTFERTTGTCLRPASIAA